MQSFTQIFTCVWNAHFSCEIGFGYDPWVGKILQRRERLPIPVFLPEEFHGESMALQRVRHDWVTFTFRVPGHSLCLLALDKAGVPFPTSICIWWLHTISGQSLWCPSPQKPFISNKLHMRLISFLARTKGLDLWPQSPKFYILI